MAHGMKVIGADAFGKKLGKYPELVGRTVESVLKQEARALCIKLGGAAMPVGLTETARVQAHRAKVARQIGEVYVSQDRKNAIAAEIKRRSPDLARAYVRASREGNEAQMRRYMREAGLVIGGLNPAVHRNARTGQYGKVEMSGPREVVSKPQLDAFIRKKQANVGTAKAGWYAAAKALGGRIRRNLVADDGRRSTIEIFPAYVKKIARKFPGLGGAKVMPGRVEIFTNVRHAEEAYLGMAVDDAIYYGKLSFKVAIEKALRRIRERGFRDAA
jgi:hypothetical protein